MDEKWMLDIQDFLDALDPQFQEACSIDGAEELLRNLESTDSNFHHYGLVRRIRSTLDKHVGSVIDDIVEKAMDAGCLDDLFVSSITDKVLSSKAYDNASSTIISSVKEAAYQMAANLHLDSDQEYLDNAAVSTKGFKQAYSLLSESHDSSLDRVDFMFMSPERYKSLAKDLLSSRALHVRLDALAVLQQVPQADLLASDVWDSIRLGLLASLNDENDEIVVRALKFFSRIFSASSSHVVKEMFVLLVEHLKDCFAKENDPPSYQSGIHFGDGKSVNLLKKFRLLNEMQLQLPMFWLRYSAKHVEDIIAAAFSLCEIDFGASDFRMSPMHFLALLDPLATWLQHWTHGVYGRAECIKQIKCKISLFKNHLESCLHFFSMCASANSDCNNKLALVNHSANDQFSHEDIQYTYFLHSASFVIRLLFYQGGQQLFPCKVSGNSLFGLEDLIVCLLEALTKLEVVFVEVHASKSLLHPVLFLSNLLQTFVNHSDISISHECFCTDRVCMILQYPFKCILQHAVIGEHTACLFASIIEEMVKTYSGRSQILYGQKGRKWMIADNSIAVTLMKCIAEFLGGGCSVGESVLRSCLRIIRKLLCLHEGQLVLNTEDLAQQIAHLFVHDTRASSLNGSPIKRLLHDVEYELLGALLSLAFTPCGVKRLCTLGMLDDCISYMYTSIYLPPSSAKMNEDGHSLLLNQVVLSAPGAKAIYKSGYLHELLETICFHLEGISNDYKRTVLSDAPTDLSDQLSMEYFLALANLLSFESTCYLCACSDFLGDQSYKMASLQSFLELLVVVTKKETKCQLLHFEKSHFFGLSILASLVTSLDTMLFLQTSFKFQDVLLQLQDNCMYEDRAFVIDQGFAKRNQLLVITNVLGGATERLVPLGTLTKDPEKPYPWPLFASFPLPSAYLLTSGDLVQTGGPQEAALSDLIAKKVLDSSAMDLKNDWLAKARVFYAAGTSSYSVKATYGLLKHYMDVYCKVDGMFCLSSVDMDERKQPDRSLTDADMIAVDMLVRYGIHLRILKSKQDGRDNLKQLLARCRSNVLPVHFLEISGAAAFCPFDWFSGVIFLASSGDLVSSWDFLVKFSGHAQSAYLWPCRALGLGFLAENSRDEFVHPLYSAVCHNIELVLHDAMPTISAAFRLSNCAASQITLHWMQQCFLNYLDFPDIVHYIAVCILMGLDYQVYFCLALLKHLEKDILVHAQEGDVVIHLKSTPIRGFRVADYFEFMKNLEKIYKDVIWKNLCDLGIKPRQSR